MNKTKNKEILCKFESGSMIKRHFDSKGNLIGHSYYNPSENYSGISIGHLNPAEFDYSKGKNEWRKDSGAVVVFNPKTIITKKT